MWLPVMDSKNQAMKKQMYSYTTRYGEKQVAQATTTDINKTIMRCLTKNLAMFGLGIYIYAGETKPVPTNGKPTLEVGDAKWDAMAKFCTENKALGYKKLCDKIGTKYTLSAGVKNEIKNLIK